MKITDKITAETIIAPRGGMKISEVVAAGILPPSVLLADEEFPDADEHRKVLLVARRHYGSAHTRYTDFVTVAPGMRGPTSKNWGLTHLNDVGGGGGTSAQSRSEARYLFRKCADDAEKILLVQRTGWVEW